MNFYASWVFRCPRWIYFKLKFPRSERVNPGIKQVGDLGEKIALKFLKKNYEIHPTRKRTISFRQFKVTGKPDFRVLGENGFEVVEVKKVSVLRKFPKKRWIAQLNLYLKMEGLDEGFLLEISGNRIRRTRWKFNQGLFRNSLRFYSRIYEELRNGRIPNGKVGECLNCGFKEFCREFNFN